MLITVCMLDYYTFAGLLYGVSDIVGWKAPSYPRSSPGAAIRQDTSREACQKIYVLVASALPVSYFVPKDVLHIAWCTISTSLGVSSATTMTRQHQVMVTVRKLVSPKLTSI